MLDKQFSEKRVLPYVMVGDGGIDESYKLLDIYISSGCKIIEVGVPFSDPAADGITIQASANRSLNENTTMVECICFIKKAKEKYPDITFILMTYLNPIIHYGIKNFFKDARIDGLIIPDLPYEEYGTIYSYTSFYKIPIIPLITLDTKIDRIKDILSLSGGFIYLITLKGITGTKLAHSKDSLKILQEIRQITDLPVVAGFGIKSVDQAKDFLKVFDGVIIASQLIRYAQDLSYDRIKSLLQLKETVV